MWYDWMAGGWGGRNGKDGANATSPVFGVGLAVQPLEGQERLTPRRDHRAPDPRRHRRAREVARRLRRGEGRAADRHARQRHVLLLRPRALGHLGHRGRAAVDPARRLAQPRHRRGALPRRGVLQRAGQAGRRVHAPVGRRRRLRRPAGARPGGGRRGRRRRLRDRRARASATTASSSASVDAELAALRARRGRHASARASEIRGSAAGWLEEDPASVAERYRDGELDVFDVDPPPRRDPRLGHGRAASSAPPSSSGRCSSAAPRGTGARRPRCSAGAPGGRPAPRRPAAGPR